MKTLAAFGLTVVLSGALVAVSNSQVMANPMKDVCEVRAERLSGYSGDRKGLAWSIGKIDFRLSGTFSFGLSHTSGSGTGPVFSPSPAFAGMDAAEQREARKKQKYTEIYQTCMLAG